jgi:hypothetical protein
MECEDEPVSDDRWSGEREMRERIEELEGALDRLIQKAGWARHYAIPEGEPQWYELGSALNEARNAWAARR